MNLLDKSVERKDGKKEIKDIHLEKQNENKKSTVILNEPINDKTSWKSHNLTYER
jgi:hypothetical protein